ncbi:similar to Saccharomyces cerevisiae YML049C RSE1 Protein involved in pre-mRNA splicing [Maudiozyma saulgeensis]|uniref:Similar to Saccharomyces cerevisiae YML049C RSE1 Protein involved in pre-mRNA splicing n=1 Tax=Maudiozyma saulgeensis TaxID=1789683 RepID=A0A1X7R1S7_9SACH|nr:similar to Saccharomyces cerevisiae YML049C RSE1 Protein involved in pre-mRNA splicing [Kazachstania saulgeensis]
MIIKDSEPYLYNLTLRKQSNYTYSCSGSFTIPNSNQLCLATENSIEIYDLSQGNLNYPIVNINKIDSTITSIGTIPNNTKNSTNNILLLSDSGNVTVLQYDSISNSLKPISIEPLTRSSIRRTSPLSLSAIDPLGRCIFISSLEKFGYMYTINKDQDNFLSSPIEVIRPNSITLDIVACSSQLYDNPTFATLEFSPIPNLIFYSLDLNLNHIIKRKSYPFNKREPNFLLALPDLSKFNIIETFDEFTNPFVLIGFTNHLIIKDLNGIYTIEIPLPHSNNDNSSINIIAADIQIIKNKTFFILLQTNKGDLLKLQFHKNLNDNNNNNNKKESLSSTPTNILQVSISYFDTIPLVNSLHIFSNGYMFANSEFNDNWLFQFNSLGSEKFQLERSFKRHESLINLSLIDTLKTLNPLIDTSLLSSSSTDILTRSTDSSLRVLSSSINFINLTSSNLPPNPQNIWTLKYDTIKDNYHHLLVLGFENTTTFLQIENDSIKDLKLPNKDTLLLKNDKTIHMNSMLSSTIIQVCNNRCIQISTKDNYKQKLNWFPPAGITIVAADSTPTQLVLALSNNDIVYLEIHDNGTLIESTKRLSISTRIISLAMYYNPKKPLERCKFLIVATDDKMINVVSLSHETSTSGDDDEDDNFLEIVSFQKLTDIANTILYTPGFIHAGLNNGVYTRSRIMDMGGKQASTGEITDVWNKYLGVKRVTLSVIKRTALSLTDSDEEEEEEEEHEDESETNDQEEAKNSNSNSNDEKDEEKEHELSPCVLATSDSTWASYQHNNSFYMRPVSFPKEIKSLFKISEITTETLKFNGCCAISTTGKLIIGQFKNFIFNDKWFNIEEIPLSLDNNENEQKDTESQEDDSESDSDDEESHVDIQKYRNKCTLPFNSYVIFIDNSIDNKEQCRISITDSDKRFLEFVEEDGTRRNFQILPNTTCVTANLINFSKGNNSHLIISSQNNKLLTLEILIKKSSFKIQLLHETDVEDRINTICEFKNMLLVPVHAKLVSYALGKKQLLKKSISNTTPSTTRIVKLVNWENKRIAVADIHESVTIYQLHENQFVPLVSDITKRHVTTIKFLDPYSVIGGDRFGNIWMLRIPEEAQNDDTASILTNTKDKRLSGNLMETPYKFQLLNHYYVNDIILNIFVITNIHLSGRDCIVYTGLQGTIGILVPIISKNEVVLLKKIEDNIADLEMNMTNFMNSNEKDENSAEFSTLNNEDIQLLKERKNKEQSLEGRYSLVGRDHSTYRSYYTPVRNIIDGDLCETYQNLPILEQNVICKKISDGNLTHEDVTKAINEIRISYI